MGEEKIKKLYLQYENLKSEMNVLITEKNMIENKLNELNVTLDVIEELEKMKKGDRILASLGSGIFVEANVADVKELIVNIGARALRKMSIEDTKKFIREKIRDLENVSQEMETRLAKNLQMLQAIEQKLEEMSKREKK